YKAPMCGCFNDASTCTSCSSRCLKAESRWISGGSILIVTVRFNRLSAALYASPALAAAITLTISYGPSLEPGSRGMEDWLLFLQRRNPVENDIDWRRRTQCRGRTTVPVAVDGVYRSVCKSSNCTLRK